MISARIFFTMLGILVTGYAKPSGPGARPAPPRPNVLIILADDLGFSDIGPYGGEIRTPNLDRLAAEGLRFTQFYNCALCTTTRAALTTGLYPRQGKGGLLRTNMVTLGELMRAAGYATALTGKWHLGDKAPNRPIDRGFDDYYGVLSGSCNYFNPARPDPNFMIYGQGEVRPFAHNEKRLTTFPPGYYTTDAFSSHAIELIRRSARAKQPFFINLCYTAPHFPLQAPAADIARYRGRYQDGYERLRERRFQRQIQLGIMAPAATKLSPLDRKSGDYTYDYEVTPWDQFDPVTRKREEERMEVYAAMVDRLDQGIGRVLAALEETGVAKNTVVFFLSDNGGCATWPSRSPATIAAFNAYNRDIPIGDERGYEYVRPGWGWAQNAPFRRHKTWTYEGGICTPMIVRWPGVVGAGRITGEVGHVVDFMPTLLELAGGEYPESMGGQAVPPMEGESLMPILRGQAAAPRRHPLGWELFGNRAVRDGGWKLVWGASDKKWELYDLTTDRSETVDLAMKYPERTAAMVGSWAQWSKQTETLMR